MEEESINITETILETINTLFSNLFSSIDNNLYSVLDDITFINTDIFKNSYLENILGKDSSNGLLLICNALLFGFVLYYIISSFLSYFTFSNFERPVQFIFKLIIFSIIMNSSFFICEQIISLNSNICLAIRNLGENLFNKEICFSGLIEELNSIISIEENSFNIFSIDGLIKGFLSFGLFNLIFSYSLRYILIKIFVLLSPFAILSLTLHQFSWFFKSWIKSFFSLLFVQIFISLILLIIFSMDFSDNLFSKFLYVGSIYALIKSNNFVKEFIGGISTNVVSNFSGIKSMFGGGN